MSGGYPSMTALLGLLAVAGFQNRDKIAELLGGGQSQGGTGSQGGFGGASAQGGQGGLGQGGFGQGGIGQAGAQGGLGGLLGQLGSSLGGSGGSGGFLSGGLGELVDRFRQNGQGEVAESWVNTGPNKEIAPHQLERAIGADVLATLSEKTGLSRDELLSRLSKNLPDAVDRYTPDGRLPMAR